MSDICNFFLILELQFLFIKNRIEKKKAYNYYNGEGRSKKINYHDVMSNLWIYSLKTLDNIIAT